MARWTSFSSLKLQNISDVGFDCSPPCKAALVSRTNGRRCERGTAQKWKAFLRTLSMKCVMRCTVGCDCEYRLTCWNGIIFFGYYG